METALNGMCRIVQDIETGELIKKIYTPDEQAKDYLLDVLKGLSLNELIDVYKTSCDKDIEKLTDGIM